MEIFFLIFLKILFPQATPGPSASSNYRLKETKHVKYYRFEGTRDDERMWIFSPICASCSTIKNYKFLLYLNSILWEGWDTWTKEPSILTWWTFRENKLKDYRCRFQVTYRLARSIHNGTIYKSCFWSTMKLIIFNSWFCIKWLVYFCFRIMVKEIVRIETSWARKITISSTILIW